MPAATSLCFSPDYVETSAFDTTYVVPDASKVATDNTLMQQTICKGVDHAAPSNHATVSQDPFERKLDSKNACVICFIKKDSNEVHDPCYLEPIGYQKDSKVTHDAEITQDAKMQIELR